MPAPYAPDAAPASDALVTATAPSLSSIQVPRAKIRQGGGPAASLMLVAQEPARFSGTIQVAGNELVTLAVNEDSYGLRWIGGREGAGPLAPGYYEGPPSRCAVETLLGVELEPEALVDVVLGGAPLIAGPHEVLDHGWDRKLGRELLRIANADYEQELEFIWFENAWHFGGASLWRRGSEEPEARWLWTIRHDKLQRVEGEVLPKSTQIRQPKAKGRGDLVLNVSYQKQTPNPALGGELSPDPPRELIEGDEEGEGVANAGDSFDDDWDDDEGWEDGEEGGEDTGPLPVEQVIPPQFIGNPTGLVPRGDLCAGR